MTDWAKARDIATEVIHHFEGCHLTSYVLKGESWATIGWGCAITLDQHPKTITQGEADAIYKVALLRKENALKREIPAAVLDKLTPEQLAAILSFRYNMKDQVWLSPKCNTRLALVRGDMRQFWLWHAKWVNGEAGPLPGLKRRRKVEHDLGNGINLDTIKAANWYQSQKW